MQGLKTISDSSDLTWDVIDNRAKHHKMSRSEYIRYACQKELKNKHIKDYTIEIFFGVILALQLFLLIIIIIGVI